MQLTERQYKKFSALVYHECGINLHDGKKQLLMARLSKRLRKTGIDCVDEYLKLIAREDQELIYFLDAISTNHTFLFRESHHFEILNDGHLNIWCAASSSGEEPYSIAIDCLEKGFRPRILATDISTKVLRIGERGIYPSEKSKNVALHVLKKYFQKGNGQWDGHIRANQTLRNMVTFKRFNLISDSLPLQEFDVIFCRNVLIYFDNSTKTDVVNKLYQALKWEGYFVIGGAESLNNIPHPYKYIKPSIYQKTRSFKSR